MLTNMTRVTLLRPAFLSRDPPCPISNQSLPSCDSDPEVPAPSVLALAHSIPPAPHCSPSPAPPDTHRRTSDNLSEVRRCVSGGITERQRSDGLGGPEWRRHWGLRIVSWRRALVASVQGNPGSFAGVLASAELGLTKRRSWRSGLTPNQPAAPNRAGRVLFVSHFAFLSLGLSRPVGEPGR